MTICGGGGGGGNILIMELDGVTRTYHWRSGDWDGEPATKETYPNTQKAWTEGQSAVEIIDRAEFTAVSASNSPSYTYGVMELPSMKDVLEVDVSEFVVSGTPEMHKKLVEAVEKFTGKKGLTIRVS